LEEAIRPLSSEVSLERFLEEGRTALEERMRISKLQFHKLTWDEVLALYLYTTEEKPREKSLYYLLNSYMRHRDKEKLKLYYPYIKLLLSAMSKLPKKTNIVWRAVRENLCNRYTLESEIEWNGFSSCTNSKGKALQFLSDNPQQGTLFCIMCRRGVSISEYSSYFDEAEVLLLPFTKLFYKEKIVTENGINMLVLEEVE